MHRRPRFPRVLTLALFFGALFGSTVLAQSPLFPFQVSYDSPDNATSLAKWLPAPAGSSGPIRAENGRFVNDAGRVRFFGTNLCFDACFPSRDEATRVARRLARFGINVVRMHHMDSRSIWGNSSNKTTIDPRQLDKLDYLIFQLKQNGIYTNINLHVSRSLGAADGFPPHKDRPKYDKGLDNFEPRMIELQKKYARDLLTHVNPYTKLSYCEDPAIAFVEINNENALFDQWSRGFLDRLPEPYLTTFRQQWNTWLEAKYGSTERLRQAWSSGAQPLGSELLHNGDFRYGVSRDWDLEQDDRTDVDWRVALCRVGTLKQCLQIVVRRQGYESWRPQFTQSGLAFKKGRAYTLSFWARSDQDRSIRVNSAMAHPPWDRLGLDTVVDLTNEWRQFQFTFVAEQDDNQARITVTSLKPGRYEFADFSLRPGGIFGLKDGESLKANNINVLRRNSLNRTRAARQDFIDFLWDTELRYWTGMYKFLKEELGVRALVCGTQLSYSPVDIQAKLDYIDAHAYWQHPRFPNRPWDRNDWYIENVAMVDSPPGTLGSLAGRRVLGMPYTISEYNHPAPNSYAAEGLPMLAAMAALQDWDGIYSFTYSHDREFEPTRVTNFFDIKGDPAKLVHLPAAAALFLRGDLAPAQQLQTAALTFEREILYDTGNPWRLNATELGIDPLTALTKRVALLTGNRDASPGQLAESGHITWRAGGSHSGRFIVSTPRTKLVSGFTTGQWIDLDDVRLRVGPTRLGWATVSMTCLDGDDFAHPGRLLIAASGVVQNSNAKLESLGGDRVTLRSNWGDAPVICEGIPLEVRLPVPASRVTCHALDGGGAPTKSVPIDAAGTGCVLRLGPNYQTLWYEVRIAP